MWFLHGNDDLYINKFSSKVFLFYSVEIIHFRQQNFLFSLSVRWCSGRSQYKHFKIIFSFCVTFFLLLPIEQVCCCYMADTYAHLYEHYLFFLLLLYGIIRMSYLSFILHFAKWVECCSVYRTLYYMFVFYSYTHTLTHSPFSYTWFLKIEKMEILFASQFGTFWQHNKTSIDDGDGRW